MNFYRLFVKNLFKVHFINFGDEIQCKNHLS